MKYFPHIIVVLIVFTASVLALSAQVQEAENPDKLVQQLYQTPWGGAELVGESPTIWDFGLTEPMRKLLEIGSPAQKALLDRIGDSAITDQVVFLLGGIGDESVIEPIINSMVEERELFRRPNGKRINRAANLALTNITVAGLIWHHGGGIVVEGCGGKQKKCWQDWWKSNKHSFSIRTINQSRRYSNYPNYGIFRGLP